MNNITTAIPQDSILEELFKKQISQARNFPSFESCSSIESLFALFETTTQFQRIIQEAKENYKKNPKTDDFHRIKGALFRDLSFYHTYYNTEQNLTLLSPEITSEFIKRVFPNLTVKYERYGPARFNELNAPDGLILHPQHDGKIDILGIVKYSARRFYESNDIVQILNSFKQAINAQHTDFHARVIVHSKSEYHEKQNHELVRHYEMPMTINEFTNWTNSKIKRKKIN